MLLSVLGLRLESNTADMAPGKKVEQGFAGVQDTANFGAAELTVGHFLAHHSVFQ